MPKSGCLKKMFSRSSKKRKKSSSSIDQAPRRQSIAQIARRRLSVAVNLADSDIEIEDRGTTKRVNREELVEIYKERMTELKKLTALNRKIQDILDPLADVLEQSPVPFDCFGFAGNELAEVIEKCLRAYDKCLQNEANIEAEEDETASLLEGASVIERLVHTARRSSVAQQHVQTQRKYYEDTPLEKMWDKVRVFNRSIDQAEAQLKKTKDKVEELREGYNKAKHSCVWFRYRKYRTLLEAAARYD